MYSDFCVSRGEYSIRGGFRGVYRGFLRQRTPIDSPIPPPPKPLSELQQYHNHIYFLIYDRNFNPSSAAPSKQMLIIVSKKRTDVKIETGKLFDSAIGYFSSLPIVFFLDFRG